MPPTETLEQVQKTGRERLYPSITNPNWLVLRKRRELFVAWLKGIPSGDLSVLDVGGRIQPYRALLGERCTRYLAIDVSPTPLVDVIGQAECLPFRDRQFDLVLCTQVLEYVPDPPLVVNEIYRTLKAGGLLLLSAPAVFPRDSETEYWRFLPCGLKRLLSKFSSVEVVAEGNSLVGFIRTTNVCLVSFARPAHARQAATLQRHSVPQCIGRRPAGLAPRAMMTGFPRITACWPGNKCDAVAENQGAERTGTAGPAAAVSPAELARRSDRAVAGTDCRGHSSRRRRNRFASHRRFLDRASGGLCAGHRFRRRHLCHRLPGRGFRAFGVEPDRIGQGGRISSIQIARRRLENQVFAARLANVFRLPTAVSISSP